MTQTGHRDDSGIARQFAAAHGRLAATAFFASVFSLGIANAQVGDSPAAAGTERLYDSVNDSVCTVVAVAQDGSHVSRGSGFILKDSGKLVTNAHVLAGLHAAKARCSGRLLDLQRIVKFDRDVDLAVADVGEANVPGLTLSADTTIRPGMQIYVFGSPYGLEGTISPGLASGERVIEGRSYIQISAPIGAGSSGGPVTDGQGAVLGITVASLEVGQNINFAIPADVIDALPDVDMKMADLAAERSEVRTAPVVKAPAVRPGRVVPAGTAAFRGNTFGTPCGDIAATEYERQGQVFLAHRGAIRFKEWYGGTLEWDVDLLGAPARVFYDCDARFGMTQGYYQIRGHDEAVDRIAGVLRSKYGSGIAQTVSEQEAKERGCLFNKSLPGSRFYRPSEWTSWRIDDRFHVDMLECGGRSTMTFLFYSDPVLLVTAARTAESASGETGFRESDL